MHRSRRHAPGRTWRARVALPAVAAAVLSIGAADPDVLSIGGDIGGSARAFSQAKPATVIAGAPAPDAPTVVGCPVTPVPSDGAMSTVERAPNLRARFGRSVYLIKDSEMATAGFTTGATFAAIGWSFQTAPGLSGSGPLIVYMQNTTDATNTKSTTWTTAITGMTIVHNATTTIPNVTGPFDVTFAGGSPFTYSGGGLYVAFDAQYPVGTLSTVTVVWCNSLGLPGGLKGAQGATAPTTLVAADFRPETRLTPAVASSFNDASVDYVVAPGSLAQPLVGAQTVKAVVSNRGAAALTNLPVTFNLTGAETFTNTQTVPSLSACGGTATVTFAPFIPAAIGSDTVTISVPADDIAGNNSKSKPLDETFNLYSYKHPGTTASGGVGQANGTADVVAKFVTTAAAKIAAVNLEFFATSATTYRVAIYPDSGSGTPSVTPLYVDAADRTVSSSGPVTIALPAPVPVGPGPFYAGIQQTNTVKAELSYDTEVPIRTGTFYLAIPHPATAWFDEAPGNNFKLNIGVTLVQCGTGAECDDGNPCTTDACTNQLCTHVNNSATSCDGNACSNPDQCVNGTCIPGPNPCNDGNACTVDLCDGQGGCTHPAFDCNDNNPCTADSCVPATGCAHGAAAGACSDGNPCTIGDACGGGVCVPGTAALPAAVSFCNNTGITIASVGAALPYPSAVLVSGLPSYLCRATVDLRALTHTFPDDIDMLLSRPGGSDALIMSDVGAGIDVSNLNLTLSDAAAAFLPDAGPLVAGTFKPTNVGGGDVFPLPAPVPGGGSALSVFTGTDPNGTWNLWVDDEFDPDGGSLLGFCLNLVAVCAVNADCDDGNVCTQDTCTGSQCTHTNNTVSCNDGNACTPNDTCSGGVCAGGLPPACNDGNACTANTCNPATGLCENPPLVCNDGNACTDDACVAGTGCVFTNDNTNTCSDGSLCTSPDVCQNGACVGQNPVTCAPDANACTTEACNPATGACGSINNANPCDDGNACTAGDACGPAFAETFDGVTAPALPAGWTTAVTGTGSVWVTVNTSGDTAPNSAFGADGSMLADEVLVTPSIAVASASATLSFKNRWSFEGTSTGFDGSVLEIAIGGGGFTDIVTAGGSFVEGGYTGTLSNLFGNPLGGRQAWILTSAGYPAYVTTTVNLPATAAGQSIRLRWRLGTDGDAGAPGQNIDSMVVLDGGVNTCHAGTPITAPPEVANLGASANKTTFTWSAATFATRYDVVRGGQSALPVGPGGGDEVCFANLTVPTLVDPAVPSAGTGYWYLSRGENSCGNGTFGTRSNGTPRTTTTCP